MSLSKGKVIVALSGGVDSSVAAALLKDEGWQVEGVFMKNWSPEGGQALSDCPWQKDQEDAARVCEVLNIPFRSINFEKEYRDIVLKYFLDEYQAGRTPNPDVMCNKEIKFRLFLDYALQSGAEWMATGHYAKVRHESNGSYLERGIDSAKDQSYFLWSLDQEQLSHALFPLGSLKKTEVRSLAAKYNLPTATKKDSQGICFIGHLDVKDFLKGHISGKPGEVRLLTSYNRDVSWEERKRGSEIVGTHPGTVYFTQGERAGQVVDNGKYRRLRENNDVPALFVVEKDTEKNILYITDQNNDPDLSSSEVYLEGIKWSHDKYANAISSTDDVLRLVWSAQARYQQKPVQIAGINKSEEGYLVKLVAPVKAISPGQSMVIYKGEIVMGGGIICRIPKVRR